MKYKTFTIRLPLDVTQALDDVAFKRFRKKGARNQIITEILLGWHETVVTTKRETKQRKSELAISGD